MNAELKAKWIEALRSGKYKQGRRKLKARNQYCCLGVLLDVSGFHWPKKIVGNADIHPRPVAERGLSWGQSLELAQMNDGEWNPPCSFAEIADYIEREIPADDPR